MKARLQWLWWTLTAWRKSTHDTTESRPGHDDQFSEWPRIRTADVNPEAQQDNDERRWQP